MLVDDIQVLALDIDGVLTDGRVGITPDGQDRKEIAFRDLDAIAAARRAGLRIALVTGEDGPMVRMIAERIQPDHVIAGAKDKHAALQSLAQIMNTEAGRICFVGDADRDALAFAGIGLGLAPADASPRARARAHRVLLSRGGAGAVAEAVDIVLELSEDVRRGAERESALSRVIDESILAHARMRQESVGVLGQVAQMLIRAFRSGNKLLLCGNGGSAADAQHVAGEIVGRFALERDPWPAMALSTDTSILTAIGNDWSFDDVFARQVHAFAKSGDVVCGISTSGGSKNVVRALEVARKRGATTLAFTGQRGGAVADAADLVFRAPATQTPRIQELHILGWHGVCEVVERALVEGVAHDLAAE